MANRGWCVRSFTIGALAAPLLLAACQYAQMLSAAAALRGLPITIISNPFLDITIFAGRKVSIGVTWLWVVLALASGISSVFIIGCGRVLLNTFKRL
ncbi:MAG: hypothetical protein JO316_01185 [Abitibacteriaceae bacterium]|nr:hypothetical protein [Abditibacteriaceae bacterium]